MGRWYHRYRWCPPLFTFVAGIMGALLMALGSHIACAFAPEPAWAWPVEQRDSYTVDLQLYPDVADDKDATGKEMEELDAE